MIRGRSLAMAALACSALATSLACAPSAGSSPVASPPPSGRSTLVPATQAIVREELIEAVKEWTPRRAMAVVLDADTGAVLAMDGRDGEHEAANLAETQPYVTGSTLKTITYAAALEAKSITLDTMLDCEDRRYGTRTLSDGSAFASLPATDALAVSSNVGASRVFDTVGLERLLATLHALHIGDAPGSIAPIERGDGIEAALLANGEWAKATPLQMTAAYAALVNGGNYLAPTRTSRTPEPVRVFRTDTARAMMGALEDIVASDLGTGVKARIEDVRVAGKTGTGELEDGRLFASFVGTIRGFKPPFVIFVGLEAPKDRGTGPDTAAPLFARIARRILGV